MRKIMFFSLIIAFSLVFSTGVQAQSFNPETKSSKIFDAADVPSVLKDWVKWANDGVEKKSNCNVLYNNAETTHCYYMSNLDIKIDGKEMNFALNVKTLEKGYVLLPGSVETFPSKVTVNGVEKSIISKAGRPYIYLDKGEFAIEGSAKSKLPIRYVFIPDNAAIINVMKNGAEVSNPTIDDSGVLRLETQAQAAKSETDDIHVFVYRKIKDGVPITMNVRLNLNVTGKERVENLGRVIPENFALMELSSSISSYVQKNGDLIVEARPGTSFVDISLRQINDSLEFVLDNSPVDQEIWVFESDNSRRVIQAPQTLRSVQTQNIPMPQEWKSLPAYEVNKGDKFEVKGINYDNRNLDALSLNRNIKLAFDGSFYSIEDNITADFREDGRLSIAKPFNFYSSSIGGEPQAITYTTENQDAGIEVRKGNFNITNILRVENKDTKIAAAGYNREFKDVTWNLQLAPGYSLIHATGADTVSYSWVNSWNLMSVFIVALLTVCMFYLFGLKKTIFSFAFIVLIHPIMPQFTYVVFVSCAFLFLQRNIKDDSAAYKFVAFVRYSLMLFLILATFLFAMKHLRGAMYPILDDSINYGAMPFINFNFLIWFYVLASIAFLFYQVIVAKWETWKKVFSIMGLIILLILSSSIIGAIQYGLPMMGGASNYRYSEAYDDMSVSAEYSGIELKAAMPKKARISQATLNNVQFDKKMELNKYQSVNVAKNIAQTGVGFPDWRSNNYYSKSKIVIYLKGPVAESDHFRLFLFTPFVNMILAFARVLLAILLIYWLLDLKRTPVKLNVKGKEIVKRLFITSIFSLFLLNPLAAKAQDAIPSNEIIKELGEKLNRQYTPSCMPECVSIPNGTIANSGDNVKVNIFVHSSDKLVVPLPMLRADGSGFVKLESVSVNGKPTKDTVKKDDSIFLLVDKGISRVEMSYKLDENADRFILYSQIRINYMESRLEGLSLNEDNSQNQNFQINRVKKVVENRKTSELSKMDIDTFFDIQRNFDIGMLWEVTTVVTRQNNLSEAATIEVPLLHGEKVITNEGTLLKDRIRMSFSPRETQKEFSSILPVEQDINLLSPSTITNYREIWSFNVDYVWSFKFENMLPAVSDDNSLTFKPRAGDTLDFRIFRPDSVDGYVITFDRVNYNLAQGRGILEASLTLQLRASDTGVHDITLPQNAEVRELTIDGRAYPITVNGNKLTVPVIQGKNNIAFKVHIKEQLGNVLKFPEFNLNAPAVNITQVAQVPLSKWVLFASGPVKGPVVLFWSMFAALLIVSLVLSRVKIYPMGFVAWFILLLGLTQTNQAYMMVVIAWFFAFGIKDKFHDKLKWKRLVHIALVLLSILFIYSLFKGIYSGLLGSWRMRIVGDGSYVNYGMLQLTWYQDAIMGMLPTPKVFSLPVWVYRLVMIVWSTWLAIMCVKWTKWGWKSFNK